MKSCGDHQANVLADVAVRAVSLIVTAAAVTIAKSFGYRLYAGRNGSARLQRQEVNDEMARIVVARLC
jgi:hypothetical protein